MLFILMLLALVKEPMGSVSEHVDLIELNVFHDCLGRPVYEQVIFYEWSHEHDVYHVRAWCLVEDRDLHNRRPVKQYSDGTWIVYWQDRDQNILRVITATKYRHSYSQIDPERANKKLLDERLRKSLIKPDLVLRAREAEESEDK